VRLKRARAVATAVLRARGNGRKCGDFVGLPAVRRAILKTVFEEEKPRRNTEEERDVVFPPWVLRETPWLRILWVKFGVLKDKFIMTLTNFLQGERIKIIPGKKEPWHEFAR
jgi:hypothetical protein